MKDDHIPNKQVLSELLEIGLNAATVASDHILKYFRTPTLAVLSKEDGSPVTKADQEAEAMIRKVLGADSAIGRVDILGEEQGLVGSGTPLRWTIDPIDGTRSFVQGIPLFGTIVALEDRINGDALLGVIHLPVFKKTYFAGRGLGSWCDKTPLKVSSVDRPDKAIISVGDPLQFLNAKLQDAYNHLWKICPCLRGYTDCFGHAMVASGAVAAMMDPTLNPWDLVATKVLVEEGGGMVVTRPSADEGKVDALFGNQDLVEFLSMELQFLP